jgi:hypothetical protein
MPSYCQATSKTTVYLDEDILRATRVLAARSEMRDSEVVEKALRSYLGIDALESIWARSDLDEQEALRLAYEAVHEARRAREPARTSDLAHALFALGVGDQEIAGLLQISELDVAIIRAGGGGRSASPAEPDQTPIPAQERGGGG